MITNNLVLKHARLTNHKTDLGPTGLLGLFNNKVEHVQPVPAALVKFPNIQLIFIPVWSN